MLAPSSSSFPAIMSSAIGAHVYDGVLFPGACPAEHLDRVRDMQFYDSDVLIATYPKAGKAMTINDQNKFAPPPTTPSV